jgi:hypothetical protein
MRSLEKLQAIDRRILYLLLALAVAIPLYKPIGLPFTVGAEARDSFNYVEQNIKPGDLVLMSFDMSTGSLPELEPVAIAVMAHLAKKGASIIGIATAPDGPMLAWQIWRPFEKELPYGERFVNLGFLAGGESGLAAFLENPYAVFRQDIRGNLAQNIPMLKGFKDVKDLKMMVSINTGPTGGCSVAQWVRIGFTTHKKAVWIGLNAVMAPGSMPYYRSGQLKGYVAGTRGAGEYEMLLKRPGLAIAGMDAQAMAHALIILFIFLGNIGMFAVKRAKGQRGGVKP